MEGRITNDLLSKMRKFNITVEEASQCDFNKMFSMVAGGIQRRAREVARPAVAAAG